MSTKNNSRNGGAATEYADAIKTAVNDLAAVCEGLAAQGLTLSAQISFGRILSVGVRPQRTWGAAKADNGDAPEIDAV
ncbi:MAG: hypothetical protein IIY62_00020 [Kiritimatiellae bacterium]|nr:hypothetical protein [Kiritimatiellia bacterium]